MRSRLGSELTVSSIASSHLYHTTTRHPHLPLDIAGDLGINMIHVVFAALGASGVG